MVKSLCKGAMMNYLKSLLNIVESMYKLEKNKEAKEAYKKILNLINEMIKVS